MKKEQKIKDPELQWASLSFCLMFLVLLFRVSVSLTSKLMVWVQSLNLSAWANARAESLIHWVSRYSQWTGEGSQWLWIWMVYLGIVATEKRKENLRVDFFINKLNRKSKFFLELCLDILYLFMALTLLFFSLGEVHRGLTTLATSLPLVNAVMYSSLTVGIGLLSVRILIRIYKKLSDKSRAE